MLASASLKSDLKTVTTGLGNDLRASAHGELALSFPIAETKAQ